MANFDHISEKEKVKIHSKYDGYCAFCGGAVSIDEMHVVEEKDGNKVLLPCCPNCFDYKGDLNLEGFRKKVQTELLSDLRKNPLYKIALSYGLVWESPCTKENEQTVQFEYEYETDDGLHYLYESHLGGYYDTDDLKSADELYCESCGDFDWPIGTYRTQEEREELIRNWEHDWGDDSDEEYDEEWPEEDEDRVRIPKNEEK